MTRKHVKEDDAPERCAECRHETAIHKPDGACPMCVILVYRQSKCYPAILRPTHATSRTV